MARQKSSRAKRPAVAKDPVVAAGPAVDVRPSRPAGPFGAAVDFEDLKKRVFGPLVAALSPREPLRVWVPGCRSGEEAYAVAIAFAEYADASGTDVPLQVFATDLDGEGIERARSGLYPREVTRTLSPARRRRFFVQVAGGSRIVPSVRETCVFARHDLLHDPPFSRIDLVSCRTLSAQVGPVWGPQALAVLHYALRPGGCLLTADAAAVAERSELFEPQDASGRVHVRRPGGARLVIPFAPRPTAVAGPPQPDRAVPQRDRHAEAQAWRAEISEETERILLARFTPPGVVVDAAMHILQVRGDVHPYLAPAAGRKRLNLLKMARRGLFDGLVEGIRRARAEGGPVKQGGLRFLFDGEERGVDLEVIPVRSSTGRAGAFLVLFVDARGPGLDGDADEGSRGNDRLAELTRELMTTRANLQSVVQQQGVVNEELQAASEEVQSRNEELRSVNEELETSKEELQSTNDELGRVVQELRSRNAELSRSNDDLVNLIASAQVPIVMLGRDFCIRRYTPAAEHLLRLLPSDLGRPLTDLDLEVRIPDLGKHLAEVVDTLTPRELDLKDRKDRWYCVQIRPYRTAANAIDGAVIAFLDVDALKRSQEAARAGEERHRRLADQLAAADRSEDEFLAMLAHELRNPLAPMRNIVELLLRKDASEATIRVGCDTLSRQIEHMTRLVQDLLEVSRITRGTIQLRTEFLDLRTVIESTLRSARWETDARRQTLAVSLPTVPVLLHADAMRLEQVLGNLLQNASKFSGPGAMIETLLEETDGPGGREAVIRVRDQGIGIAPEMLPRIFELFVQADNSTSRIRGGLGIGLTLARRLIEFHGGRVEASSEGPGSGSEFVVRLPVPGTQQVADDAPRPVVREKRPERKLRILVVDDNVDAAESLAMLLRTSGHDVCVAFDGPSCLESAQSFGPEAVLMDIGLPAMDGYEAARRLRRMPRTRDCLLVATTGYGQEKDRRLAVEAGFDHHLVKPVDLGRLREILAAD